MEENLGVGLGAENGAPGFQVAAEFHVIVDFAVKDDVPAPVGGGHGLGPAGEIEDAEATVAEPDGGVPIGPFRIRTAVREGTGHGGQDPLRGVGLVAEGGETGDAAHREEDSGTRDGVSSEEVGGRIKIKIKFKCRRRRVGS